MKVLLIIFIGFALMGCGNEFVPASGSDNGNANNGSNTGSGSGGNSNDNQDPINPGEDFAFSASVQSSGIFGNSVQVIRYNSVNNSLEIIMPFNLGGIELEVSGSLPNYPDVTFETNTLDNTLVLSIPLDRYLSLSNNTSTLPNGRTLPGIPGGEPPSFGFPVSNNGSNAYIYLAPSYLAVYAETNIKLPLTLRVPIKSNGQIVGYIHLLAPTSQDKGGVFFSVQLPRELTALIESIQ